MMKRAGTRIRALVNPGAMMRLQTDHFALARPRGPRQG